MLARLRRLVGALALQSLAERAGLSNRFHAVVELGSRAAPDAAALSGAQRLPRAAPSDLFGFMGSVWFTPTVTLDRAMLIAIWTAYIFIGSWLKDRRLEFFLGEWYREYETEVPGYPGMLFGPLGRLPPVDRHRRAGRACPIDNSQSRVRPCPCYRFTLADFASCCFTRFACCRPLFGAPMRRCGRTRTSPSSGFPVRSSRGRNTKSFRRSFGSGDVLIVSWPGCTIDSPDLELFTKSLAPA